MQVDDAMLFIDTNKYLDLYRMHRGKELLAPLAEQAEYIFVTQQVVEEFQRNKISVAAEFFERKFKKLKPLAFNVPEHLSGSNVRQGKEILQQIKKIGLKIKQVNNEVNALTLGIMEQINCSEDEVSKVLSPIFAKAVSHSPEELQKAKDRRELGSPPGKITNPIGDQLTWEQILSHFKGKKRLWIISRDGDYGTVYGGKGFLNHFLYNELCKIVSTPKVYLFEDMIEGINHFVKTTGVKAEERLTKEEAEEIEKEEKTLPPLTLSSDVVRRMWAGEAARKPLEGSYQPSEEMRRVMKTFTGEIESNDSIRSIMAELNEPSESVRRAMDMMSGYSARKALEGSYKPSEEMRSVMKTLTGQVESNDSIRSVMAKLNEPSESVRRAMDMMSGYIESSEAVRRMIAGLNEPSEAALRTMGMMSGDREEELQTIEKLNRDQGETEE